MRRPGWTVTFALAGWVWADILVALFAIFAVANTIDVPPSPSPSAAAPTTPPPGPTPPPTPPTPSPSVGVDRNSVFITVSANGRVLLEGAAEARDAEQKRIVDEALQRLGEKVGPQLASRRVAMILAYGYHDDLDTGRRLAELGTGKFTSGIFRDALVKAFHNHVRFNPGTHIDLEVFFFTG